MACDRVRDSCGLQPQLRKVNDLLRVREGDEIGFPRISAELGPAEAVLRPLRFRRKLPKCRMRSQR
jgi:hypothetical protein